MDHNVKCKSYCTYVPISVDSHILNPFIFIHLSDVEAFARAMQGGKGDSKEKKEDDEDMSLD